MRTAHLSLLSETEEKKERSILSTQTRRSDGSHYCYDDNSSSKQISFLDSEGMKCAAAPNISSHSFFLPSSSSSSLLLSFLPANLSSFLLRQCLDLLLKVQKTQAEGLDILTFLCNFLFPNFSSESNNRATLSSSAVVKFNEIDRKVVQLRILEVKHSSLNPKLFDVIENLISPLNSFLCDETRKKETGGDNCRFLLQLCSRVVALRDQLMCLAQLQEEAIQSLGAQLSALFSHQTTDNNYIYNNNNNHHGSNINSYCNISGAVGGGAGDNFHILLCKQGGGGGRGKMRDSVFRFFQQLDDVMASKQHIILCLATTLREICDPAAVVSSFSSLKNEKKTASAEPGVSVSLSPISTRLLSCSVPHEDHLQSQQRSDAAAARVLPADQMREFSPYESGELRDVKHSPSPRPAATTTTTTTTIAHTAGGVCKSHEGNFDMSLNLRQPVECDSLSKSATSRSPPSFTGGTVEMKLLSETFSASPPPPLARCLQQKEKDQQQNTSRVSDISLRSGKSDVDDGEERPATSSTSASLQPNKKAPSEEMEEAASLAFASCSREERGEKKSAVDYIVSENARLRRLLETKDNLILGMQDRLLSTVPLLIERVESNNRGSNNSNCSCHSRSSRSSRSSSTQKRLGEDKEKGAQQQKFSASVSCQESCRPRSQRDASDLQCGHESNELGALREELAACVEDNRRLQAALSDANDKKQHWKHVAEKLKEDNKTWREKEQAARVRCEELEDAIIFFKKKLLTVESSLLHKGLPSAPLTSNDVLVSRPSSINQCNNLCVNNTKSDDGGGGNKMSIRDGFSPLSTQSRSQKKPSPQFLRDDVTTIHTSTSLQQKRSELLAKLGMRRNGKTQIMKEKAFSGAFEEEDHIVEVSPLTEERGVQGSGAVATTSLPVSSPSSSVPLFHSPSLSAIRIDRRLSPEYQLAENGHVDLGRVRKETFGGTDNGVVQPPLSTTNVNRILSSARSLLASIDSVKEDSCGTKTRAANAFSFSPPPSCISSTLLEPSGSNGHNNSGVSDTTSGCNAVVVMEAGRRTTFPERRSVSPYSSFGYSSAKEREQSHFGQQRQSEMDAIKKTKSPSPSSLSLAALPPKFASSAKSPQQKENGEGITTTPSPQAKKKRLQKPRSQTAREALIRELREQLHQLQSQHASVLHQAEQLQLKRERVVVAIGRQGGGTQNDDRHDKLEALLKRFDATQQKVSKNEAQLSEYMEIVKRQLKTLEDDLL